MAPRAYVLLALAALLVAPAASAHQTAYSVDQKYRFSIGHLNEPVTTYVKTGLDVGFTLNDAARTAVPQLNPGNLTATLVAPNGETLSMALQNQFGTVNHFTFTSPYVLTQSGVYKLRLTGSVFGSAVNIDGIAVGSTNPVPPLGNVTFPDSHVPTNAELRDQVQTLQARLAELEGRQNALEAQSGTSTAKGAPSLPAAPALVLLLAAVAVAARRRAE
ncbi:MAG: hypothetical protein ABR586_01605 [Thermoplasmatota archaeon]